MTHEPECHKIDFLKETAESINDACCCRAIRAAYQRGREDAAKAIMTMKGAVREPVQIADIVALAINAARGDGEQA